MSIRFYTGLVLSIASLSAAAPAAAQTVIDFNSLTRTSGYSYVYGPYQEDGFTLTSSSCANTRQGPLCFNTALARNDIDPAGASIVNYHGGATVTLAADDGSAFLLRSINVSEYFDDLTYGPGTMSAAFSFSLADGTTQDQTFTFETRGRYPVTTLAFDLGPLTSFSFRPTANTSGFLQFDDITLDLVSSAVPEPSTWALLVLGFGAVGHSMRRRRVSTSSYRAVQAV